MHVYASRVGRWSLAFTFVTLVMSGAGCARPTRYSSSLRGPSESSLALREARVRATSHTISATELRSFRANSVYELVSRLRPEFVRRGYDAVRGTTEPTVYIDDLAAGPLSVLLSLPVNEVAEIHYITPAEAFTLHGSTQRGGIIAVRLRRR
jgi:hypothetical protein